MKTKLLLSIALLATASFADEIPNRLIDYQGFLDGAAKVGELRKTNRVNEDRFLELANDPKTVILDARSAEKFAKLHIKSAVNLSLPDFNAGELAKIIPSKSTRVLIYCNNNFLNAPGEFPSKTPVTALNINTFNSLVGYGYTNVFELGPLLEVRLTKIPFEGTSAAQITKIPRCPPTVPDTGK